jgi:hypothetical protein
MSPLVAPSAPAPAAFAAQSFASSPASAPLLSAAGTLSFGRGAATGDHGDGVELEGTVGALDVAARSLIVHGTTVTVAVTTVIRHGHTPVSLADLKVGDRIHVKGARNGAAVVASEISVENVQDVPGARDAGEASRVRLTGPVAALSGACPTVTFLVGSTKVTTSSATKFFEGNCAELANGAAVHVGGTRQSDGSIAAVTMFAEDPEKKGPEKKDGALVRGVVAGLEGACPAVTFTIGATKVVTSTSTKFLGGECGRIAGGVHVAAKGQTRADGSVEAAVVAMHGPPPRR